jgi:nucleoside 2-deoxyribosyltransferase
MNKLCYLAGAMSIYHKNNEIQKATKWREIATHLLKDNELEIFNPMCNFYKNTEYNSRGVLYQNLLYLNKADIILVNLDCIDSSPGTLYEIFLGHYLNKPVIAFGKSELINQPHVRESVTINFDFLDEACDYIKSMYHS